MVHCAEMDAQPFSAQIGPGNSGDASQAKTQLVPSSAQFCTVIVASQQPAPLRMLISDLITSLGRRCRAQGAVTAGHSTPACVPWICEEGRGGGKEELC